MYFFKKDVREQSIMSGKNYCRNSFSINHYNDYLCKTIYKSFQKTLLAGLFVVFLKTRSQHNTLAIV